MRAALARPRIVEASLVLGGALLLALAITWPLVLHFGTDTLGGGAGGDRSGYVWDVWFNGEHGLRLWGTTTQDVIGAPFGREQPASINALQIVFLGPAWLVTQVAGPIAAVNASVLLGMTLAPAAMYLLIRWLGLGIGAAAWAAVAFAVFPRTRWCARPATTRWPCSRASRSCCWCSGGGWRRRAAAARSGWPWGRSPAGSPTPTTARCRS